MTDFLGITICRTQDLSINSEAISSLEVNHRHMRACITTTIPVFLILFLAPERLLDGGFLFGSSS